MKPYRIPGILTAFRLNLLLYIAFLFIVYISFADGSEIGMTSGKSVVAVRGSADIISLNATAENPPEKTHVENVWSVECIDVLTRDFYHALSSPLRWRSNDCQKLYLGTLTTIAVAGLYDPEVRQIVQRNRSQTSDDMAKFFNRLGSSYPSWILSSFYLGGLIFNNSTAKMVGLDGLAATLLTSAAIVPFTKRVFGRSRPNVASDQFEFDSFSGNDSFPSGHTARAFVTATVIA
ncbi:MAG: phosphatase PAP2 family protein, partial [Candidatus Zixiibacteriota bacterium]